MSIDPGISVLVSFVGFSFLFFKKIYPKLTSKIDEHIQSIKDQIEAAEKTQNEANLILKNAYFKKNDIERVLDQYRVESQNRLDRLRKENDAYLDALKKKYEITLKTQLESELNKKKIELIEKISDIVIDKVFQKFQNDNLKIKIDITKEDIIKLVQ